MAKTTKKVKEDIIISRTKKRLKTAQETTKHTNGQQRNKTEKSKSSDSLSNCGGLTHFMELGARTDLICDSTATDPLGPDSFGNQWIEVKQESPEDIEVCKVTLTELPLKVDDDKLVDDVKVINNLPDTRAEIDVLTEGDLPELPFNKPENEFSSQVADSLSVNTSTADEKEDEILEVLLESEDNSDIDSSAPSFIVENKIESVDELPCSEKKNKYKPQECDICNKVLYSKGNLRIHKFKMHNLKVQFACELCSDKFDYQRQVVKHRNSVHRGADGRFGCDSCAKRVQDFHAYLAHVRSHEDDEKSDKQCVDCGLSFNSVSGLRDHQAEAHPVRLKSQDKNFTCDTCGRRFAFSCQLRDHINTHTGVRPYLCQECGKAFCQKSTLKQHTKTHSEVRPYQCAECPLGFYSKSDYVKHRRKHTGERPYVCEVCGEAFSRNTHLVVHRRTHTGERPHVCDICNRGFTKRGDVVRHRRVHTGELPYLCQVCGKAFRQSTQCANHIKSQHPDSPALVARNPNPLLHVQVLC